MDQRNMKQRSLVEAVTTVPGTYAVTSANDAVRVALEAASAVRKAVSLCV